MLRLKVFLFGLISICLTTGCQDSEEQQIVIHDFFPSEGIPGTLVTILGKNLGSISTTKVYFSGVEATIESAESSKLKVKVPINAITGKIEIISRGNKRQSVSDFVVPVFQNDPTETIKMVGIENSRCNAVWVDQTGNILVTGTFIGTVDFGGKILHAESKDIFVAKYDSENNIIWVNQANGDQNAQTNILTVDDAGNIFIAGTFIDKSHFGNIEVQGNEPDKMNPFIAKVNNNGEFEWVSAIKGGFGYNDISSLDVTPAGHLIASGSFSASLNFGSATLESSGMFDAFVVKLNSVNGDLIWVKQFGGIHDNLGGSFCIRPFWKLISGNLFQRGNHHGQPNLYFRRNIKHNFETKSGWGRDVVQPIGLLG